MFCLPRDLWRGAESSQLSKSSQSSTPRCVRSAGAAGQGRAALGFPRSFVYARRLLRLQRRVMLSRPRKRPRHTNSCTYSMPAPRLAARSCVPLSLLPQPTLPLHSPLQSASPCERARLLRCLHGGRGLGWFGQAWGCSHPNPRTHL